MIKLFAILLATAICSVGFAQSKVQMKIEEYKVGNQTKCRYKLTGRASTRMTAADLVAMLDRKPEAKKVVREYLGLNASQDPTQAIIQYSFYRLPYGGEELPQGSITVAPKESRTATCMDAGITPFNDNAKFDDCAVLNSLAANMNASTFATEIAKSPALKMECLGTDDFAKCQSQSGQAVKAEGAVQ